MLLKPGVDISRLNRGIRRFLSKADVIYATYDEELVITSTYEGTHGVASLHYANDAIDARSPKKHKVEIFHDIRAVKPELYDVVDETTHYHVEYDPH